MADVSVPKPEINLNNINNVFRLTTHILLSIKKTCEDCFREIIAANCKKQRSPCWEKKNSELVDVQIELYVWLPLGLNVLSGSLSLRHGAFAGCGWIRPPAVM
jgi:hypothetical protein